MRNGGYICGTKRLTNQLKKQKNDNENDKSSN